MKYRLLALCMAFSGYAFAGCHGGTPDMPCYVGGEYAGNIPVTDCQIKGGTVSQIKY